VSISTVYEWKEKHAAQSAFGKLKVQENRERKAVVLAEEAKVPNPDTAAAEKEITLPTDTKVLKVNGNAIKGKDAWDEWAKKKDEITSLTVETPGIRFHFRRAGLADRHIDLAWFRSNMDPLMLAKFPTSQSSALKVFD